MVEGEGVARARDGMREKDSCGCEGRRALERVRGADTEVKRII